MFPGKESYHPSNQTQTLSEQLHTWPTVPVGVISPQAEGVLPSLHFSPDPCQEIPLISASQTSALLIFVPQIKITFYETLCKWNPTIHALVGVYHHLISFTQYILLKLIYVTAFKEMNSIPLY